MIRIPRLVHCISVDHNGYCDRNYHPTDDMIGLTFTVRSVHLYCYENDSTYAIIFCDDSIRGTIEFVEHEVEEVVQG